MMEQDHPEFWGTTLDRPGFWDHIREDPIVILGPAAALALIVLLAMLLPRLGG